MMETMGTRTPVYDRVTEERGFDPLAQQYEEEHDLVFGCAAVIYAGDRIDPPEFCENATADGEEFCEEHLADILAAEDAQHERADRIRKGEEDD